MIFDKIQKEYGQTVRETLEEIQIEFGDQLPSQIVGDRLNIEGYDEIANFVYGLVNKGLARIVGTPTKEQIYFKIDELCNG